MSFIRGSKHHNGFPKAGEELVDLPGRHTREGWTEVATHASIVLHGKQYKNMKEWSRPCVVCGAKFSAFESATRVDANSQFSSKTCKDHRGLLPAIERGFLAWSPDLGGMVPGPSCASGAVPNAELEQLRMINKNMKEELDGFYAEEKAKMAAKKNKLQKMPWEA